MRTKLADISSDFEHGFYNEFISNILLNAQDIRRNLTTNAFQTDLKYFEAACRKILAKSALVDIHMTANDIVAIETNPSNSFSNTLSIIGIAKKV